MYIAVVPIHGTINQRMYSVMRPVLEYVSSKNKVKGAIIHINSGGGEAVASELFYNHFMEISAKKPVYAYIEGTGASGAYWIALSAQKIYAFSGSVVGSIGVLSIIPNVRKMLDKIGVEIHSIKIGEYKDALMPFGEKDPEAEEMVKKIMQESYERFVSIVRARRRISDDSLNRIAQGQIFSVSQALEERLVDNMGTFGDVVGDMSRILAGLKKYKVITPPRPFFQRMFDIPGSQGIMESILSAIQR